MRRNQSRGAIVEWVEHPVTKRRAPIRLNKYTMTFSVSLNEEEPTAPAYQSKDGNEVKQWLLKQLKRTSIEDTLEWQPVIEIEYGGERRHRYKEENQVHGESLSLSVNRYWIALTKDQREWRKLPWEACDPQSSTALSVEDRYANSAKYGEGPKSQNLTNYLKPFRLPSFKESYNGDTTVLAFTPELWSGLLLVVKHLAEAREMLKRMVATKDGIEGVSEIGAGRTQLLLTAPAKERKQ